MKLKNYFTALMLMASASAFGQVSISSLTSKGPNSDTSKSSYEKTIGDAFIGFGFVYGPSDGADKVKYGESREFIVGLGIGRKFVKWNGVGIDIYYKSTGFFMAQDSAKVLPNNIQHTSEKISFDNLGGLVFDRFYLGSKLFFDGGFYFDWAMVTKHVTWDNYSVANAGGGSSTHSIDRQLVFLNSTNYGLTFRFGNTAGASLYFNYRLTNVFDKSFTQFYNLPLPPYVIGIVIGGH